MGQANSKAPSIYDAPPVYDEDISISRRRRHRRRMNKNGKYRSGAGLESGSNVDNLLNAMGVMSEFEESPLSDSYLYDEITPIPDHKEAKHRVRELYDQRLNRYKARLSAMYPERSTGGAVNISRLRTTTMMEVVSYIDTPTQLNLKLVSRYFRKLVKISLNEASLNASTGWIDAIHLSTFLKRIVLVGEPKEEDLREFTKLLRNDGFMQLKSLELYVIGEWALLEILDALAARIDRELSIGILDSAFEAELVIQENEFSPYFAMKFASLCNTSLSHVLSHLTLICNEKEGVYLILRETKLYLCSRLFELDLANIPLGRDGYELLYNSLWPIQQTMNQPLPTPSILSLPNTQCTDASLIGIATAIQRGLLTSLNYLDLSQNNITKDGMKILINQFNSYLCPNIEIINLSGNLQAGHGCMAKWFLALAEGISPRLSSLSVNTCGLNDSDIEALSVFIASSYSSNLVNLDIGNNLEVISAMAQLFQALSAVSHNKLKSLNFESLNIEASEIDSFCYWLKQEKSIQLTNLIFRNNNINSEGLLNILTSLQDSSIQHLALLDISSNAICNMNVTEWNKAIHQQKEPLYLENVDFAHNPFNNNDFAIFLEWSNVHLQMNRIKEAIFEDNMMSTAGIKLFFQTFPVDMICELRKVCIISIPIRTIGASLQRWLKSPAVTHLHALQLVNCSISKMDLTYMINAFETSSYCQDLRSLRLSGNHEVDDFFVTDFIRIYEIPGILPYLCDLDLSYTDITKVSAYAFLKLFERDSDYSLRLLNMSYTRISNHRIRILHQEFRRVFKGGFLI